MPAHKQQVAQRLEVSRIGGSKRVDVCASSLTRRAQPLILPVERRPAVLPQQQVAPQTRMTPITVGKRVDLNEPVVKTNHDFIGWERLLMDPECAIVHEFSNLGRDRRPAHADIFVREAITAGPLPGPIEHAPVKLTDGRFFERRAPCSSCPLLRLQDVHLLPGEQLLSGADVSGYQSIRFFGS